MAKLAGMRPLETWGGSKSYAVASGQAAIERLRRTGATAGFEFAANEAESERIFSRFAELLEQKYKVNGSIAIVHRYAGGIAVK
jgi:hypothetical protein